MPERALLVDFGSTYTKARLVDLRAGVLLAAAQAPSTVGTDVMDGLSAALDAVPTALLAGDCVRLACSSAAGGLRIAAVGLVRELTAEAATRASLGAGARVIATYTGGLTTGDVRELEAQAPDMVVLAGGTDGGNRQSIEENARALAASALAAPIVVAGNRNAKDDVVRTLRAAGKLVIESVNVLPELDRIEVTDCAEAIRRTFMAHIVRAKGLERVEEFVGDVAMPTPQAVLAACELIATGAGAEPGLGDLVCVDVGGATTDVYSIGDGLPEAAATVLRGLPEPHAKRTVEGDLGVRINARSVVELAGAGAIQGMVPDAGFDAAGAAARVAAEPWRLPDSAAMRDFDLALATTAARTAVRRHAGTLEVTYGPRGRILVQTGKDLRRFGVVLATGGVFQAHPERTGDVLDACRYTESAPEHLTPAGSRALVDTGYILYAVGLLSRVAPEAAMRLARNSLVAPVREGAPL